MPLTMLIYIVYSSLKNGGRIGKSIFFGHFLVEIILVAITFVGASTFLESAFMQILISLAASAVCLGYAIALTVAVVKNPDDKRQQSVSDISRTPQMSDIYAYGSEQEMDEDEPEHTTKKTFAARSILAGILLSASNLGFIMFVVISVPAMTFQTNFSFGGKVNFLTTLLFLAIFIAGEFILYIFLPKIIAIIRRWIRDKVMRVITGLAAAGFFLLAIPAFLNMIGSFKFLQVMAI